MQTISIANQKGGVGKSTTAQNLAAGLKLAGKRVLIVDFDPQSNTTDTICGFAFKPEYTIKDVLDDECSIRDTIVSTDKTDIIPGSKELAGQESTYASDYASTLMLYSGLKEIEDEYDYVVIDTPPNLGVFMISGLIASDSVIVVADAETYAITGLTALIDTVQKANKARRPLSAKPLEIEGVLLTMYNKEHALDRKVAEKLSDQLGPLNLRMLDSVIGYSQELKNAQEREQTIYEYRPKSKGAIDYANLVAEIVKKFG